MSGDVFTTRVKLLSETCTEKNFSKLAIARKGIEVLANKMAKSSAWKAIAKTKGYKDVRGLARDLYIVGKKRGTADKLADYAAMGATMTGAGYLADKYIQHDMKKDGEEIDVPENKQEEEVSTGKKIRRIVGGTAAALGTVGGTLFLAKKGKLNKKTLKAAGETIKKGFKGQFVHPKKTQAELDEAIKTRISEAVEKAKLGKANKKLTDTEMADITNNITKELTDKNNSIRKRINYGGLLFNIGFPAASVISYHSGKKAKQDQINQTEDNIPDYDDDDYDNNLDYDNNYYQNQYSENDDEDEKGKNKKHLLKKAVIGTTALAGAILAARYGKLGPSAQIGVNNAIRKAEKTLRHGKISKKTNELLATGLSKNRMGAKPRRSILSGESKEQYLKKLEEYNKGVETNKNRYEKVLESKHSELLGKIKKESNKNEPILSKIVDVPASFLGYGKGERAKLEKDLTEQADKSGNELTKKVGHALNPKNLLLGSLVGTTVGSLMFKPLETTSETSKKALKKIDKKAFAYEDSKNAALDDYDSDDNYNEED